MDPTSFQFRLTMPGDSRLVGAVRNLSLQAASYAKLTSEAGRAFAQNVTNATESAIESTGVQDAPIEFHFDGAAGTVRVTISWPRNNGSRETREVRHPSAN